MSEEVRLAKHIRAMLFEDGYQEINIVIETLDDLIRRLLATAKGASLDGC